VIAVVSRWLASLFFVSLLGCSRQLELDACSIADESCQQDVYYAVVRLRGDGWDPFDGLPPIRTITLEQYRDELTPDEPAKPADPDAEPKPPEVDPWDVALRWLGLVTPSSTAMQAATENRLANVAAYYSSREQRVTVIDRGRPSSDDDHYADTVLLVHELVHAFQDNEVRAAPVDHTTDGGFAGRALIEGEARLYEHLAAAEIDRVSPQNLDWHTHYARRIAGLRSQLSQQRSPFYAVSWFVYDLGADMLMNGWLRGGNAAVRELGATFPRTAVGFMARHEGMTVDGAPKIDCRVDPPDDGFELAGHDRFGAMQLYAFLTGAEMHEPDAWRSALGWRDDRLWLYFDEESEQVALSWRVRLASTEAADAVVAIAEQQPMLRAERRGNDALIVGSEVALAAWPGAVDCAR
jgi:hypothetical protein